MRLRTKNLADYAQEKAISTPEAVAIYLESGQHIEFASIFKEAMALATSLSSLGLKAGDVISFQLPNWRETVAIDIAAVWLGLVVNPVIPIYRDHELAFILADSRCRCLFIPGTYRGYDFPQMIERLSPELPDLQHVIAVRHPAADDQAQEPQWSPAAHQVAARAPGGGASAGKSWRVLSQTVGAPRSIAA